QRPAQTLVLVTNVQFPVFFQYHQQKPSSDNKNLIILFQYFHKFRHITFPTIQNQLKNRLQQHKSKNRIQQL
ncbi:hypothetical protein KSS87_017154, partial [Heliosperma pusillum]